MLSALHSDAGLGSEQRYLSFCPFAAAQIKSTTKQVNTPGPIEGASMNLHRTSPCEGYSAVCTASEITAIYCELVSQLVDAGRSFPVVEVR